MKLTNEYMTVDVYLNNRITHISSGYLGIFIVANFILVTLYYIILVLLVRTDVSSKKKKNGINKNKC